MIQWLRRLFDKIFHRPTEHIIYTTYNNDLIKKYGEALLNAESEAEKLKESAEEYFKSNPRKSGALICPKMYYNVYYDIDGHCWKIPTEFDHCGYPSHAVYTVLGIALEYKYEDCTMCKYYYGCKKQFNIIENSKNETLTLK